MRIRTLTGRDVALTCVRAVVDLEVLQAREALVAGGTAVRFLVGVSADVDEHLVPTRNGNISTC